VHQGHGFTDSGLAERLEWEDRTRLLVCSDGKASMYDFCDSTRFTLSAVDHSGDYTGRRSVELVLFWSPQSTQLTSLIHSRCTPGVE
jgi:hypothetical protein